MEKNKIDSSKTKDAEVLTGEFAIPKVTLSTADFELTDDIAQKVIVPIMNYLMMTEEKDK